METSGILKLAKLFFATAVTAFGLALFAGPASAEDTVWICKPGQVDDLCAGSISTTAGGEPIGFARPEDAPVDCFYVYRVGLGEGEAADRTTAQELGQVA